MTIGLGRSASKSAVAVFSTAGKMLVRLCLVLMLSGCVGSVLAQSRPFMPVFEAHSLPMLLIEPDTGDIVEANPAASRFYGYPRKALTSMHISQINTFDAAQVAEERQLAASQARNYFIFRHVLAEGDIRTVEVHAQPVEVSGQRLLWSTIVDISPGRNLDEGMWHYQQRLEELVELRTDELKKSSRKTSLFFGLALAIAILFSATLGVLIFRERRAQAAQQQINDRLAYREALLSSLFDQSGYLIGVLDQETRLIEVNRHALETVGATFEEVIGQRFEDTPWWRESDKPGLRHCLAKGLAGEAASFEALHVRPDGSEINVLLSVIPVLVDERRYLSVMGVDMTAHLVTTRELARTVDFLTLSESVAGVGHWIFDLPTGKLDWSSETYRMFGVEEGTPISYHDQAFMSHIHPDDRAALDAAWQAALETGGVYEFEHRVVVEGEIRWIRERADLALVQDGRVVGTALDITQRKLLEHQLAEQGTRLRTILEGSDVGTWEWNIETGETVFNERWAQIIGYTLDEISPVSIQTWLSFVHPDDKEHSAQALQAHFSGLKEVYECEARMRHKNGDWVWVLDRGKVFEWSSEGRPLRMAGTHLDITDRKRIELQLKHSQEVLQSAIDTIGEAFVIYDENDRLLICNNRYREVYPSVADLMRPGVTFEEIVRTWVNRGAPDLAEGEDPEAWVKRRLELHRSGQLMIQHTDNDRWVRIIERKTPAGHIVGFRVDITDLIRANQAAEAANIAKSRFLATMSHEIRTPLNGILGMAQLMLIDEHVTLERFRDNARVILQSGQQLLSLLNDVLDLAKVESNALTLENGVVQPDSLLQEARGLFSSLANDKGLELSTRWLGEAGEAYVGDPYRLAQALNNLINNAIKFTEQGSVEVIARVLEHRAEGDLIELSVTDTGPGIPREKLFELFKPFSQLDSTTTRKHGGTGLGLAIVSSMAHAMGGDVGVESEPGQGSRFWFTVCLKRNTGSMPVDQGQDSRRSVEKVVTEAHLKGRLLVVEDNLVNCKVIQAMLKRLALTCELRMNGAEGLEAYKADSQNIDLILMDMEMPVLDGCMATQAIREWEGGKGLKRVPIVALTANAFAEDKARCLAAGMDDFLSKPVKADQLVAVLSRWLQDEQLLESDQAEPPDSLAEPDWTNLIELIDLTVPMLLKRRFDAIRQFEQIEVLARNTRIETEVSSIAVAINAFRFVDAAERLNTLRATAATEARSIT